MKPGNLHVNWTNASARKHHLSAGGDVGNGNCAFRLPEAPVAKVTLIVHGDSWNASYRPSVTRVFPNPSLHELTTACCISNYYEMIHYELALLVA
jgi:hypothetical protein